MLAPERSIVVARLCLSTWAPLNAGYKSARSSARRTIVLNGEGPAKPERGAFMQTNTCRVLHGGRSRRRYAADGQSDCEWIRSCDGLHLAHQIAAQRGNRSRI